jgi:hypothetical protein
MYFTTRDIAAIAVCSALWGVLNTILSPVFWELTKMPFLCDLLAFTVLVLVIWWTEKFGAASFVGVIVTVMTLMLRPTAFHMTGFLVASVVFDVATRILGYGRLFQNPVWGSAVLITFSVLSAGIAGIIIGAFFMGFKTQQAILSFAGLHALGGLIGGAIGVMTVRALIARRVRSR